LVPDGFVKTIGTSASSAIATGILARLIDVYRRAHGDADPTPEELRGLVIHTAVRRSGQGPSYETGYGLLDGKAAAQVLVADGTMSANFRRLRRSWIRKRQTDQYVTSKVPANVALRFTLAWIDPVVRRPRTVSVRDHIVNDLDIVVTAPTGKVFYPWTLNPRTPSKGAERDRPNRRDNIEQIDIEAGDNAAAGAWTVSVIGATGGDAVGWQRYSLIASEGLSAPMRPVLATARARTLSSETAATSELSIPVANLGGGRLRWVAETRGQISVDRRTGIAPSLLKIRTRPDAGNSGRVSFATVELTSPDTPMKATVGIVILPGCEETCGSRTCGSDVGCSRFCGRCPLGQACSAGICVDASGTCPTVTDLASQTGGHVFSGDTRSRKDSGAGTCGGGGSPDVSFSWRAPTEGLYKFEAGKSSFNTVLRLTAGSCNGPEVACASGAKGIERWFSKGEQTFVTVDGINALNTGEAQLSISEVPAPEIALHGERAFRGELSDRAEHVMASCSGDAERRSRMSWEAPQAGAWRFSVSSESGVPLGVALREHSYAFPELVCRPPSVSSTVAATLASREVVQIEVFGSMPAEPYFLSVEKVELLGHSPRTPSVSTETWGGSLSLPKRCTRNRDCVADDERTWDWCLAGVCRRLPANGCLTKLDCEDGDTGTVEECHANVCTYSGSPSR
jgi:hypothetical protein